MNTQGVLYLSIGEDFAPLTRQSIAHLRRTGYTGPVRVVTDADAWASDPNLDLDVEIVQVPSVTGPWGSRHYKTQLDQFAFDTTLYLDSDTLPIAPIDAIWDALRWGDICLAHDLESDVGSFLAASWEKTNVTRAELEYVNRLDLHRQSYFNSGVMLWRRSAVVNRLFAVWHEEWQRFRSLDQMALVRAIAVVQPVAHTLSPAWNCPAKRFHSVASAQAAGIRILHFLSQQRSLLEAFVEGDTAPLPRKPQSRQAQTRGEQGLRVLWITGSFYPRIGGLELFIQKTIGSLSEFCEVGLVTKGGQWYPGDSPIAHFSLQQHHVPNQTEAWSLMADDLKEIIPRFAPDIVHFGSARSASCRAVIPPGIPTVATVHGNDLTDLRPAPGEEDQTNYIVECLNHCDHIFAVSNHTASLVRQWGVLPPLSVLSPGCDLDFYHPAPELGVQARKALRIPANRPVILTVSRLAPRKGHLTVLDALERLPFRAHWIVVGEGPCREELASEIVERQLQRQVSLLGGVSDDDLLALYNACDVFVLVPEQRRVRTWLDSEGFGLVLHEAGACGKPVVASADAGCKDAVIDGGTGILVPPGNAANLAEVLSLILTNKAFACDLGNGGHAFVHISGGWSRLARQTHDIYEELVAIPAL
jgi:glycosyltransferase involved in cell wall biosynthesis